MKEFPQKFPPGSKWLYLRIYGGPQALEEWLTGRFRHLLSDWRESLLVRQFHYIHYLDPDYHLRLRFLLSDPVHAGVLLNQLQQSCTELLEEDLIWKIEVGTYEPEYERYGINRMALIERWFEIDSLYWLDETSRCSQIGDQEIWKSAIRSVDIFLEDLGANLDDKIIIINRLNKSAVSQFVLNKAMNIQLDDKYRKMSGDLKHLFNTAISAPDISLVNRSADAAEIIEQLNMTFISHPALMESTLIPDLIHMSLNRAFRTRHRLQELVLYDFMNRFYESVRARGERDT